ncbi:MAG: acyl-CoA reductase [Bacteroidota bacterium]|nr:acyl-CoA reductase [Bacteroidota bacterium]
MTTDSRIKAFIQLGEFLQQFGTKGNKTENNLNDTFYSEMQELITISHIHNPWFTEENICFAMEGISSNLSNANLNAWIKRYTPLPEKENLKQVLVIMAGNVPMVGFHDFLCVLVSGNRFLGKLSSDDKFLLPFISRILIQIEPGFKDRITFSEGRVKGMDAVIATGSNNTARYFEYYFGKYPGIIRKNRNSVAVLTGNEKISDLRALGNDIFQYFGLGCRNVSKLFVPEGYKFDTFYESVYDFSNVINNNKYGNNYDYNRTVYLMSSDPTLLDNNFLLLRQDIGYSSPIGVLFYEFYKDVNELTKRLKSEEDQIQCIVSSSSAIKGAIPFGDAQCPGLSDYADGVDTMRFLSGLK